MYVKAPMKINLKCSLNFLMDHIFFYFYGPRFHWAQDSIRVLFQNVLLDIPLPEDCVEALNWSLQPLWFPGHGYHWWGLWWVALGEMFPLAFVLESRHVKNACILVIMMGKEEWREQNGYGLIQASNSKTISFGWLKIVYFLLSNKPIVKFKIQ